VCEVELLPEVTCGQAVVELEPESELVLPLEMSSPVVVVLAVSSAWSCAQASPPSATVPTTLAAARPIVADRIRAALL